MDVNSFGPLLLSPTAVDADGVCASQSPGAGAILINGAFATAGVATITLNGAHLVRLTSGGNDAGITFTFTGTDSNGRAQSETVAGTNAGNSNTTKYFKTITAITASAAVATTIVVGNLIDSVSNTINPNLDTSPIAIGIGVTLVSGTVTYKVQHSYQDGRSSHPSLWFDNSAGAKSASSEATYSAPVACIRLLVSASASAVLSAAVVQGG
jgi:hypothetical protein